MTEAQIQSDIGKFLKAHPIHENFVCELKIVHLNKQKNFRFSQLQSHQKQFLIHDFPQTFYYKISDSPIFSGMKSRFTASKPFDFLNLFNPNPYIAVCFFRPHKTKFVCFINPQYFLTNQSDLSQPALTAAATFHIDLLHHSTTHPRIHKISKET